MTQEINLTKTCSKCLLEKRVSCFNKQKEGKFGVTSVCRDCKRLYRIKTKEHIQARRKRYTNSELGKAKVKEYYEKHKESIVKRKKEHYQENKESILSKKRKHRLEHKEELKAYKAKYRTENKIKHEAHEVIRKLVHNNKISKPKKCSICNKENKLIHGHHEDYTKPTEVIWCCPMCHSKFHKKENVYVGISRKVSTVCK